MPGPALGLGEALLCLWQSLVVVSPPQTGKKFTGSEREASTWDLRGQTQLCPQG